jgi:RNA polymerase sigma-70 factor, ECF subfamily
MAIHDPTEQEDFLPLYIQNEEALRAFVRSMLPTRDDAREVMQEVALVLWQKFGELREREKFRAWAYAVARMRVLAFLRDRSRDRHVFGDDVLTLLADEMEENTDAFEAERAALETCLKKLDPARRTLLDAAYAPGVRIDTLAASAGRSAMSVYKALHRIRLTLMECTQRALSKEEWA